VRREENSSGLRGLLVAEWDRSMARWRILGRVSEYEEALKSGAEVLVSSSQMLRALSLAGLSYRQFAYGGSGWGKTFMLDDRDQLHEWSGGD